MPNDRPVLKVCGLTRVADVRCAEAAGADFCGFITEIPRSPRSLSAAQATLLARGCRVAPVLVVESMPPADIAALAEAMDAHAVQLHGGDAPYLREVVEALGGETFVWRPVGIPEDTPDRNRAVESAMREVNAACEAGASAIVLDTRTPEGTGGSGRTCDWDAAARIVRRCPTPVMLAGGISPENLAEALSRTGAAGLDLSSSLERDPGCKSPRRLRQLARAWHSLRR